jgi:ADP-ribose pyrophosphatase YjhB (NUDIX family)
VAPYVSGRCRIALAAAGYGASVRLDFDWAQDGRYHQYCAGCHAETVSREYDGAGRTYYRCATCGGRQARSIVLDPQVVWWVGPDGEYWHESAGVFVLDRAGRLLLFERTIFPFVLTVPSGHVDVGEEPVAAAGRELKEEVGLTAEMLVPVACEDIVGDSCRRGSDAHRWHAFACRYDGDTAVNVVEEGRRPVWLTVAEALAADVVIPVRHMLTRYGSRLVDLADLAAPPPR